MTYITISFTIVQRDIKHQEKNFHKKNVGRRLRKSQMFTVRPKDFLE